MMKKEKFTILAISALLLFFGCRQNENGSEQQSVNNSDRKNNSIDKIIAKKLNLPSGHKISIYETECDLKSFQIDLFKDSKNSKDVALIWAKTYEKNCDTESLEKQKVDKIKCVVYPSLENCVLSGGGKACFDTSENLPDVKRICYLKKDFSRTSPEVQSGKTSIDVCAEYKTSRARAKLSCCLKTADEAGKKSLEYSASSEGLKVEIEQNTCIGKTFLDRRIEFNFKKANSSIKDLNEMKLSCAQKPSPDIFLNFSDFWKGLASDGDTCSDNTGSVGLYSCSSGLVCVNVRKGRSVCQKAPSVRQQCLYDVSNAEKDPSDGLCGAGQICNTTGKCEVDSDALKNDLSAFCGK